MRGGAGPGRLRHRVGEAIARHGLWEAGDAVAVAVSGGLDSTALLHLLVETARWHGAVLSVVHVDHGIRPDSGRDAEQVLAAASDLGLPSTRHDLALGGDVSEGDARVARYAVLDGLEVDRVALAHHRDDQAETLLLHLLRGTGTAGIAGMAWRRGRYVRPLLDTSRAELEAWARSRGVAWREDPSNRDPRHLRSRVRHEVMPLLEALRPGAAGALARSAAVAGTDAAWLEEAAEELARTLAGPPWPTDALVAAPAPLARRVLLAVEPTMSARQLDAALDACARGAGAVELRGGRVLEVVAGHLVLRDGT